MTRTGRWAAAGLSVSLLLMAAAAAVPALSGWNVRVNSWPPLHAEWGPRLGPGTAPALLVAIVLLSQAQRWSERLSWPRLLIGCYLAGLAWMISLALVDGVDGISEVLEDRYEYMGVARRTDDVPGMLEEFTSRITYAAIPRNWPVHVAGHPPGATLFFILLVRLGLGSGLAAGLVVTAVAASTAVAVLVTMRLLGAEKHARLAAPFLVLGPAAIWQSVSGDAVFAAVGCWGLAALAAAATSTSRARTVLWAVVAGGLLGYLVMMSYGLWLYGAPALTVLLLARGRRGDGSWSPLTVVMPIAALVAAGVVLVFAAYGFNYLEALGQIHIRYFEAVGGRRPASYWMWGNLAAFSFSAGPMVGAAVAVVVGTWRGLRTATQSARTTWWLAAVGFAMVLVADLSQMSKAEVERIWLPFAPLVLVGCALLPPRWRRAGLVVQAVAAVVVQHLLVTTW